MNHHFLLNVAEFIKRNKETQYCDPLYIIHIHHNDKIRIAKTEIMRNQELNLC